MAKPYELLDEARPVVAELFMAAMSGSGPAAAIATLASGRIIVGGEIGSTASVISCAL
ncbi:hypothetical protein [Pseudomonas sp. TWI929]|uniref:hypothetical protein n=1 Tax=Pseudomonas sp. TWI929 TaxID=3136795 RepID=UPI00320B3D0C